MYIEVSKDQFDAGTANLIRVATGTMLRGGQCDEFGDSKINKVKYRKETMGDAVHFYQFVKPEYA